jgi:selenide,water dikinase
MTNRPDAIPRKLTANVKAGGCAAKLSSQELGEVLRGLPRPSCAELLTSIENFEDAAVYKLTEDLAIIQTVDFFPPVVDDPYLFGLIAATNALSDVYAMGGRPILALNILCFPTCDYPLDVVREILRGGSEQVAAAGAIVAGGHSIQSAEPVYGLCVTGVIAPGAVLTNGGARAGDNLVLCKPIGTGVGLLGLKGGILSQAAEQALINSMTTLSTKTLECARAYNLSAATDVTGFGLIGHLHEMAKGSGLTVRLNADAVPLLPEVQSLAEQGFVPAGAYGNRKSFEQFTTYINDVDLALCDLLFDPQTSGGLLLALDKSQTENLLRDLKRIGVDASCIGEFFDGSSGEVEVVSYGKNS